MFEVKNDGSTAPERFAYPFDQMKKVGDWFFVAVSKEEVQKVRVSASNYGKSHGVKFRVIRDGEGYRVWRVK